MKQRKIFSQWIIIGLGAVLALSGCTGQPTATSTPAPSAQEDSSPLISASGEVVPARWTTLSFAQAGNVDELLVKEGDAIKAGDVIARLSVSELQANLAQKQAAVKVAEASLAQLTAPAREEDIRAAQEAVNSAHARVAEASAQRDLLYSAVSKADILQAETQVYAIQTQKDKLDDAMRKIINRGGFALAAGEPVGNQQKYAELELAAAQQVLDDLIAGPTIDQRRIAEARIGVAQAQAKVAQARLDLLKAGAAAEDIAIARAKIAQARAEAAQLEAQLAQTQIVAPFDGVLARVLVDAHQFVGPGTPVAQVADLTSLRVETDDLSENDVARIHVGDAAQVRFDALPDVKVAGIVARLDPKAKAGAGVNYTAVIQLEQLPDALRWGMTANADINAAAASAANAANDGLRRVNADINAAAASAASAASAANAANDGLRRVNATGKALPANKAVLSAAVPGPVAELRVDVGTPVKQGDVIVRLDTSVLDAEVAKAEAGLALAQASLDRVKAGPRPEQILEARSALSATQAAVAQAAANRDEVKKGATQAEIDQARAAVQQAYIEMVNARTRRDVLDRDREQGDATGKQVDDANELYVIANRQYEAAQLRLDKLLAGAELAAVRAAQAGVSAGTAELAAQQAQVDRLLAGASPEDVAVLEASVAQAQAGLDRAKAARQQAEIVAPFDGTISEVLIRSGQYVNAGQPIVLLGDLGQLQVETTDLNEKDVAGLKIGDKVSVTFDALPGIRVDGAIAKIAPMSSKTTGVNYTATIDLAQIPEGLRWGMTALVDIVK